MATEKSSASDAKALAASTDSLPNGSKASVAKSNRPKPSVDEIRTRAYEIFQARHGGTGSEIDDWQKAEASVSADASKGVRIPSDTGTIREALTKVHSSPEQGLTQEEATSRLKQDGPNAIEEKRISP